MRALLPLCLAGAALSQALNAALLDFLYPMKMPSVCAILVIIAVVAVPAGRCETAPAAAPGPKPAAIFRQAVQKEKVPGRGEVRYLEGLPAGYAKEAGKRWPLVVFLHGIGERGTDTRKVAANGLPRLFEAGEDFPFILLSPQCEPEQWWDAALLDAWLERTLKSYRVDRRRVYLTGLSMGGFGTWAWAQYAPKRFAAIAPICGGGDPKQASNLKRLPIWAFHGDQDKTVSVTQTEQMIAAVREAGGEPRVTIYPGVGHNSWGKAYSTAELFTWLLEQKR